VSWLGCFGRGQLRRAPPAPRPLPRPQPEGVAICLNWHVARVCDAGLASRSDGALRARVRRSCSQLASFHIERGLEHARRVSPQSPPRNPGPRTARALAIFMKTQTISVHHAKAALSRSVALFGGTTVPLRRFAAVSSYAAASTRLAHKDRRG
jgi:hypothetical protein